MYRLDTGGPGRTCGQSGSPTHSTLIEALIALGRGAEADEQARRALARVDELGSAGYVEIQLRLAAAEAFLFVNDAVAAEHQLVLANRELDRRAQKIPDAAVRARYLSELPENARVRALLAQLQPGGALRE